MTIFLLALGAGLAGTIISEIFFEIEERNK